MSPVIVAPAQLRDFADALLRAIGAPPEVAGEVSNHLLGANLSGHDSQGVGCVPAYAAQAIAGDLVADATPAVLRELPAVALFDARRGFGQYSTAVALDWCLARARTTGLAAAAVRHSNEVGRVGAYVERAAGAGMLAIVTVGSAGPGVGSTMMHGARGRFFGPNPWAFAAPGRTLSMTFDGSTSTIDESAVRLARAKREEMPPDCVHDAYGRPSTDPDDFVAGGALVPLGGAVAGHKGSALALASALFGGLAMIGDPQPSLAGLPANGSGTSRSGLIGGIFVQVVDPAAFGDPAAYRELVDATLDAARGARPGAGRSEVLLPGEPEARTRAERSSTALRLPDSTWTELLDLARRLSVRVPDPSPDPAPGAARRGGRRA